MRRALSHIVLVIASACALYPVLWVVKMAFSVSGEWDPSPLPIPSAIDFGNFAAVIGASDASGRWLFGRQLANSLVVSCSTAIIGVVLSCTAAYAFSRFRFPGRDAGLFTLLATQTFPGVVVLIPIYVLLDTVGLVDSLVGLVLVYSTTAIPFSTWMLKGYFDTIPREMEEAALMDGASPVVIFLRITLPLARPAIAMTLLFSFMTAWNEFILSATLMGDAAHFTLPVALQRLVGEHHTDFGRFAAGSVLVSLPVMAAFYATQRHLVRGLTAGSVKG